VHVVNPSVYLDALKKGSLPNSRTHTSHLFSTATKQQIHHMSRLRQVTEHGQQIWLDNLSRQLIQSGHLAQLIDEDGVSGVTSNPAILLNALKNDPLYQDDLKSYSTAGLKGEELLEALVLPDVQAACDVLRTHYNATQGQGGYVSFEVSPLLSHDAIGTLAAVRRLWGKINRPNAMIKIPATPAGIQAMRGAIAAGININMTLLFSSRHVRDVFTAYTQGLQDRLEQGLPFDHIHAVASVFVSRIDAFVDAQLPEQHPLRGQVAIASARHAYRHWQAHFGSDIFAPLARARANPMSCLWASTGSKNPSYRDTLYVESLIGPCTINTVPQPTLSAFRSHGVASRTLDTSPAASRGVLTRAVDLGIDLERIGQHLQTDGLRQFEDAFSALMTILRKE
jgi:transaldolase